MIIKKLIVGQLQTNCFVIGDEVSKESMVIDPGDEPDRILDVAKENDLTINMIVCTHTHFDHIAAIPELKDATNAKLLMHREEQSIYKSAEMMASAWGFQIGSLPEPDVLLSENDEIGVGIYLFKVLHTPGHSPGGICLYRDSLVISGDTLFADSIGRTDLPGGSMEKMKESFKRLMNLPGDTHVLPGHGPETNIGHEKTNNFFSSQFL